MRLRIATPDDAAAIATIYAPVVTDTAIAFELEPPTADEMRRRLIGTLGRFPWLVSLDDVGLVSGYAYAGAHRERAAYQWSVDMTVYVRAASRGRGVGRGLYCTGSGCLDTLLQLRRPASSVGPDGLQGVI
jgi:phosphinothricin acetyltransferase